MIRKILPFLLSACLIFSLAGCMGRDDGTSVSSTASPSAKATPTPEVSALPDASQSPETSKVPESSPNGGATASPPPSGAPSEDFGSFGPIREALQGVYGDRYAPDTRLTEEQIRTELGLDESLYEEVFAENVSGGRSPDMFIAVKAKAGKAEEVKKKLTAYKDKLSGDKNMSSHMESIQAAQVYAEGDYVFFLLTGASGNGESSEGVAETIGKDIQSGIDAIKKALQMQ
jgi:hypothetical protein